VVFISILSDFIQATAAVLIFFVGYLALLGAALAGVLIVRLIYRGGQWFRRRRTPRFGPQAGAVNKASRGPRPALHNFAGLGHGMKLVRRSSL